MKIISDEQKKKLKELRTEMFGLMIAGGRMLKALVDEHGYELGKRLFEQRQSKHKRKINSLRAKINEVLNA